MYYYYERNINVLPKAIDGNLDYGLVKSMMALDLYKQDGDSYKTAHGTMDNPNEEKVEF